MSELENDFEVEQDEYVEEVEAEEVEEVEESDDSEPSDLAPDSEAEHEEQPQDEHRVNQEKVNQVINRKHREAMEWKEKYEALMRNAPQQQQEAAPEILPLPDPFDDDYDSKVKARDESIQQRANWEADQKLRQQHQQATQQAAQRAQLEQLQAQAKTYTERAKAFGIPNEELQAAANTVAQAGLSDKLAVAFLGDEDGPLFTKYLASNPMEAYELAQMDEVQAAFHLERVVRPKVQALKPKKTNAPKPTTKPKSVAGDKDLGKYQNLGGAKFE